MAHVPGTARVEVTARSELDVLLDAALSLAGARDVGRVAEVVRGAARALTGADGVTFVLREGREVHYLDEDAIAPLWKGMRFPVEACVSGWAMLGRRSVVIEDVFADDRVPHDLYRRTFVKSLAMVPVRPEDPVGAIGAYWAGRHRATPEELGHLAALAGFAAVALANVALVGELRQAIEARDAFLAVAAHELRTPLSALALQVELHHRRIAVDAASPHREDVDRIARTTRRLAALVERLLDVSALGERAVPLRRAEVDLVALARDAVERAAARAEIRVDAPAPVVGRFDPIRMEQVIENLVANAVKFAPRQPVEVAIVAAGDVARLTVRDRGIGIPPEAQARIFDRFQRAVPTRHYGGLGLGLWVVRQTVEAHGGSVRVESAPGQGSTFTVELPLR